MKLNELLENGNCSFDMNGSKWPRTSDSPNPQWRTQEEQSGQRACLAEHKTEDEEEAGRREQTHTMQNRVIMRAKDCSLAGVRDPALPSW